MHKRFRMAELKAIFDRGDFTDELEQEALSLDRRWPAIKAALMKGWEEQVKRQDQSRRYQQQRSKQGGGQA